MMPLRLLPLLLALALIPCATALRLHAAEPQSGEAPPESVSHADAPAPSEAAAHRPPSQPAYDLPELVISSSRITALDVQIRKLTKKIDRAKRSLKKSSSLDESLNTDDIPKLLSILGGYTTGQRKSLASERLTLMEAERSILEAMKHVRTHREERELTAQLHAIKSMALALERQ